MHKLFQFILTIFFSNLFIVHATYAQDKLPADSSSTSIFNGPEFTISYSIDTHKAGGIAETYNGGIKTVFVKNDDIRIRQVSLMRMQSIFINYKQKNKIATIVKESGKDRYKFSLDTTGWKYYNKEFDSSNCEFFNDDSLLFLNYMCKKAVITLSSGDEISAYYFPTKLPPVYLLAEPLFSCIPGIVLQYEYKKRKNAITYTAESITDKPIAESVFKIPSKGYKVKHFTFKKSE